MTSSAVRANCFPTPLCGVVLFRFPRGSNSCIPVITVSEQIPPSERSSFLAVRFKICAVCLLRRPTGNQRLPAALIGQNATRRVLCVILVLRTLGTHHFVLYTDAVSFAFTPHPAVSDGHGSHPTQLSDNRIVNNPLPGAFFPFCINCEVS